MKKLTKAEEEYYADLDRNMDIHVKKFKRQKLEEYSNGNIATLESELQTLTEELAAYDKGNVSDLEVNIEFKRVKLRVLTGILDESI